MEGEGGDISMSMDSPLQRDRVERGVPPLSPAALAGSAASCSRGSDMSRAGHASRTADTGPYE